MELITVIFYSLVIFSVLAFLVGISSFTVSKMRNTPKPMASKNFHAHQSTPKIVLKKSSANKAVKQRSGRLEFRKQPAAGLKSEKLRSPNPATERNRTRKRNPEPRKMRETRTQILNELQGPGDSFLDPAKSKSNFSNGASRYSVQKVKVRSSVINGSSQR